MPVLTDDKIYAVPHAVGESATRVVTESLASSGDAGQRACRLADAAHALLDRTMRTLSPENVGITRRLTCRTGCCWCCYLRVTVYPAEAIRIARHLRARLDPTSLDEMIRRVQRLDARVRGLDGYQRLQARRACALLRDDLRTAYDIRPLMCRAMTSFDVAACKAAPRSPGRIVEVHSAYMHAAGTIGTALEQALTGAGLQGKEVELTSAMRVGLEAQDAAERWLAGEQVFAANSGSGLDLPQA